MDASQTNDKFREFNDIAKRCADKIKDSDDILLVSHIDADGLTSAGIMCQTFERMGKKYEVRFEKSLHPAAIEDIVAKANGRTVVFTDLGSGWLDTLVGTGLDLVVLDHHVPKEADLEYHLNPHLIGLNGATDISGSGCSFITSINIDPKNVDLAGYAIVGAIGDLQDNANNRMVGLNVKLLEIGKEAGVVECRKDLKFFGKQTRPIYKMLQFNSDPFIPGLTANEKRSMDFIISCGIEMKDDSWKRWIDLTLPEKQKVIGGLLRMCIENDLPKYKMDRIIGDTYQLLKEEEGTELRDASEFSTILNATARYGHDKVGLGICMGNRDASFHMARDLLEQHRHNLVRGIEFVTSQGVTQMDNVQWFHAGKEIRDTIVGIVAGMCMGSNIPTINRHKPIFAFSYADEGGVKVSGRATKDLTMRGVHLGKAMGEVATELGGGGGGHDIAAGANVPRGQEEEFMKKINVKIGEQIAAKKAAKAAKN